MTEAQCAELVERLDARLRELDVERAIVEMKAEAPRTAREALARRANGGPPSCAHCLDEIPPARLRAHPLAVRCRECGRELVLVARRDPRRGLDGVLKDTASARNKGSPPRVWIFGGRAAGNRRPHEEKG